MRRMVREETEDKKIEGGGEERGRRKREREERETSIAFDFSATFPYCLKLAKD